MFAEFVILTLVCVGFEIALVNKISPLLDLLERYKLAALVFSLVLSVALGTLFGAEGLTVFIAGLCSTYLVQPYYRLKKNGTIDRLHEAIDEIKARWNEKKDVYARRGRQLARGVVLTWKVFMAPFVFIGMCMDRADDLSAAMKRLRSRFSMKG